jgi:hypothetical protein
MEPGMKVRFILLPTGRKGAFCMYELHFGLHRYHKLRHGTFFNGLGVALPTHFHGLSPCFFFCSLLGLFSVIPRHAVGVETVDPASRFLPPYVTVVSETFTF